MSDSTDRCPAIPPAWVGVFLRVGGPKSEPRVAHLLILPLLQWDGESGYYHIPGRSGLHNFYGVQGLLGENGWTVHYLGDLLWIRGDRDGSLVHGDIGQNIELCQVKAISDHAEMLVQRITSTWPDTVITDPLQELLNTKKIFKESY